LATIANRVSEQHDRARYKLAAQIDRIVNPKENVIPISRSEVPA
jgi:hypothetical protein